MNDGLEPETVDVILENRKLTAELADLRQQLAEANEKSNELARAGASSIIRNAELRDQLAAQAAELATLRERLAAAEKERDECNTYHAPRIAELERLNKEQFDRFSDLLSVLGNINQCRTAEGDSITILCDNPEAVRVDRQAAVEVSGAYTDFDLKRFYGSTWQEALQRAADCARRYYSG